MTEIKLKQFGEMLLSRPAGREAWLVAQAYSLPKNNANKIIVDFDGVLVLSPSWADEFITKLKEKYTKVELINTSNASVKASLEII